MRASWAARLTIIVAGTAVLAAGAVTGSARALGGIAPPARADATSVSMTGGLTGVAAVSADSAWAVGHEGYAYAPRTLMLHWNGSAWTRVTSPAVLDGMAGEVSAVTVVSARDAWAVGDTGSPEHTLILHWNGTAWSQVTSLAPIAGTLTGVTATATSGWAVGSTDAGYGEPLILRWNGKVWSRVPAPTDILGAALTGVAVTAADTAWAVGLGNLETQISGVLARWNGKAWQWAAFPVDGVYHDLNGIAAGPRGTAFAVGFDAGPGDAALSMTWNGTSWQPAAVGAPKAVSLNGVTVAPGGTWWAAGSVATRTAIHTLIARWTGKAWTRVASPSPGSDDQLNAVAFAAANAGWAVGSTGSVTSITPNTLILRWNGKTWS